jgi:hypothetical protein
MDGDDLRCSYDTVEGGRGEGRRGREEFPEKSKA